MDEGKGRLCMFLEGIGDFIKKILDVINDYPEIRDFLGVLYSGGVITGIIFDRFFERRKRQIEAEGNLFPMLRNKVTCIRNSLDEKSRLSKNEESIFMLSYTKKLQNECHLNTLFNADEISRYKVEVSEMKTQYENGVVNISPRYVDKKKWKTSWGILYSFFCFITDATVEDTVQKTCDKTWQKDEDAPHITKRMELERAMIYIIDSIDLSEYNIFEWLICKIQSYLKGA
jgi:hypothetical protein